MSSDLEDGLRDLLAKGEAVEVVMPDGSKGYKLTEKGLAAAAALLERSPSAREMMAKLTAQAALKKAREPEE